MLGSSDLAIFKGELYSLGIQFGLWGHLAMFAKSALSLFLISLNLIFHESSPLAILNTAHMIPKSIPQ